MSFDLRGARGAAAPRAAAPRAAAPRAAAPRTTAPRTTAPRAATALLAAIVICAAACGITPPTSAPPAYTAVPVGPTVWPSGTIGRYGLRIDPSLMGKLPASVGALAVVENPGIETQVLDDADLANSFDGYAAASIGDIGGTDWLYIAIGRLKPDNQNNADFYTAWVEEYATGACSQAGAVASSSQQTINERIVDVSTCSGGPVVYTLSLGSGLLLSMYGLGPRDLGRKLIEGLH